MKNVVKYIFIIFIFVFLTSIAEAAQPALLKKNQSTLSDDQRVEKRRKKLLSAFFLLKGISGRNQKSSKSRALTVLDRYHDLSIQMRFLHTHELYSKYGFNEAVQSNLESFSRHKYSFQKKLALSGKYIEDMTEIFSEKGLPRELVFLPLIESGFDPYAHSHKKAVGPWQFMSETAKGLGLRVDEWVDERRDPVKSTEAAAEYLQYLYKRFGSWNLALAAYNAGEGKISRALRKTAKKDYWSIRESSHIKKETKNYVPSYIAATAIAMQPRKFGFKNIPYHKPPKYDEVLIDRIMDFDVVAKFADVKPEDIRDLNPELRQWCTPPDVSGYKLKIPKGSRDTFIENYSKIRGDELDFVQFYKVRKGDTVEKIAKKVGTSIREIVERNDLGRRALVIAGRHILIPIEKQLEHIVKKLSY